MARTEAKVPPAQRPAHGCPRLRGVRRRIASKFPRAPGTYLLSPPPSFRSRSRSHLRRRKRLRRGDALGVEQLDHGVSSSLEGVISMAGGRSSSLAGAAPRGRGRGGGRSRAGPASGLRSGTFPARRSLKRRRRSEGVDALDQSARASGAGTCSAGGGLAIRLAAGMGPAAAAGARRLRCGETSSPGAAGGSGAAARV